MTKQKKLAVLGSINADHVISVPHFARPGETLSGSNYHIAYTQSAKKNVTARATDYENQSCQRLLHKG